LKRGEAKDAGEMLQNKALGFSTPARIPYKNEKLYPTFCHPFWIGVTRESRNPKTIAAFTKLGDQCRNRLHIME
jgi:hypothetical protein